MRDKELETLEMLSEMVQSGILDERNFVSVLHGMLNDKIIDQDVYLRLGNCLKYTSKSKQRALLRL